MQPESTRLTRQSFGHLADGRSVDQISLRNRDGTELDVLTCGGIIRTLRTRDRRGDLDDVVLGFETLEPYAAKTTYLGSLVGRYSNRIARGRFALDGRTYTLATNNGPNHLHGGADGWNRVVWEADTFEEADRAGIVLRYLSPDGEEGYPGTVRAEVTYTLTDANDLVVDYRASTDKATVISLTQHSYFNLAGHASGDILGHEIVLDADRYLPVDDTLIPTGELLPVTGTPFDFRHRTRIGAHIDDPYPQLRRGEGYDHTFVLRREAEGLARAAFVLDPGTGRTLDVRTTEPGVQFYSGNHLDGTLVGKRGRVYTPRSALCLETQHFPDSPNHPTFPSTVLRPGDEYRSMTIFKFGVAP
jgi:aldose 1-epimerase